MRKKADGTDNLIKFDVLFLLATLGLLAAGTVMVYSSSFFICKEAGGTGMAFTERRLTHILVGITLMGALMWVDYHKLLKKPVVYALLGASIISLVMCFIPGLGLTSGGAKRWVRLGFLNFQASELLKIAMILYLSYFLNRQRKSITDFSVGVLPILLVSSVSAFLILIEPDFGTAGIIFIWSVMVLFMAGMHWKHLSMILAVTIPLGCVVMVLKPYRVRRLLTFVDPWKDMHGDGFQIIQSLVAYAKGGWTGAGLGEGTQKLFFLPAPHTDFILAVLGEEMGFIGVACIIALFGVWVWRGFTIAMNAEEPSGTYLAMSAVTLVAIQAIINIGVTMSLLPTTGVALPFFSYGGTTLVTTLIACGMVLSVSRRGKA